MLWKPVRSCKYKGPERTECTQWQNNLLRFLKSEGKWAGKQSKFRGTQASLFLCHRESFFCAGLNFNLFKNILKLSVRYNMHALWKSFTTELENPKAGRYQIHNWVLKPVRSPTTLLTFFQSYKSFSKTNCLMTVITKIALFS